MPDSSHREQPTCFVAMPVTTPSNYAEKLRDTSHFAHVLDHLFTPALTEAGYRTIAPTSRGAQLIHAEIIRNLELADLVLCDLSSLNANVFFELGIRTSLDRPVALVKDKLTERIPFDLNAINTHTYDESLTPWTLSSEIEQLTEHVKAVETDTAGGNDMWHYFGLTKRATPAEITGNRTEAKLDLLLTEMTAPKNQTLANSSSRIRNHLDRDKIRALSIIADAIPPYIGSEGRYSVSDTDNGYMIEIYEHISNRDLQRLKNNIEHNIDAKITAVRQL